MVRAETICVTCERKYTLSSTSAKATATMEGIRKRGRPRKRRRDEVERDLNKTEVKNRQMGRERQE